MTDEAPRRPALRWHGGKWLLAPWIIRHFPEHRVYVEPFGGAASVLLRKPRSYAEVYNDLDGDVVNLFRVLRDPPAAERLVDIVRKTPFARDEFRGAYDISEDPVEEARRLIVRSFMGFGSDGFNREVRTGFRAASNRSGTTPAHDWVNYPDSLRSVVNRFSGVVVENKDAAAVLKQQDGPKTLHYVDPPYVPSTRSDKSRKTGGKYHAYRHEMDDEDHAALLALLGTLEGTVVLSGYPSPMYEDALRGWRRVEKAALADGALKRTEVLWIKSAAGDFLA